MAVCILLFDVVFVSNSIEVLLVHFTLTFGIPSIGAVGLLGHLTLHATWLSELHAVHCTGSVVLHALVWCGPRHLLHLILFGQFSVVWSY